VNYSVVLVQLPLVREAAGGRIATPADAHRACADIAGLAQESLHVLTLDSRNRLVNRHMVSLGLNTPTSVLRARFRQKVMDHPRCRSQNCGARTAVITSRPSWTPAVHVLVGDCPATSNADEHPFSRPA
jgi:hypothetical protein